MVISLQQSEIRYTFVHVLPVMSPENNKETKKGSQVLAACFCLLGYTYHVQMVVLVLLLRCWVLRLPK